jgi:hypothetical protein
VDIIHVGSAIRRVHTELMGRADVLVAFHTPLCPKTRSHWFEERSKCCRPGAAMMFVSL